MAFTTRKSEILIFESKHDNQYFDASTPEKRAGAFLHVLRQNFEGGWYYEPQAPEISAEQSGYADLSDEQLAALPAGASDDLRAKRDRAQRQIANAEREYRSEKQWWDTAVELLGLPQPDALARKDSRGRSSAAEELLEAHRDYEYEGYRFESFVKVEA